jgi:hypothetical protein
MDSPTIRIVEKRRILKYAEGADPQNDEPYAIEEKEHVLEGEAARALLINMGVLKEEN